MAQSAYAQITDSYRRLAREKEGFRPMLRTKINLEKVRCWDEAHQQTKVPDSKFKNADLWQLLDQAVQGHEVEWYWVKGHSGHIENEIADDLANLGAAEHTR